LNGVFEVTGVVFVAHLTLLKNLAIVVTTNGIDYTIPDNAAFYNTSYSTTLANGSTITIINSESVYVPIDVRSCIAGEEMLSSGAC